MSAPAPATFLTPEEIHELTDYELPRFQIAWLRNKGWRFEVGASGRPRVARAYWERRMVGEATTADPAPVARHNFGALRRVK